MALAFGTTIYDGARCKIFTITYLDNDAPANLDVTFDGLAGRPTPFSGNPVFEGEEIHWVVTASAADVVGTIGFTRPGAGVYRIRKLTPVGGMGANAKTFRICVRMPRGIAG